MIAVAVLVLLAVVAAGAGSDGADDVCVEAELRRVTITPDKLPVALLASTQLLYSATHDPDTDNWARELLDTHQDIQTVAQLSKWAVSISYRDDDNVPGGNASSASYLRSLEVALNKTTPGFWAPPFWDCYLSKWVFGFTTPLQGDRKAAGLFYSLDLVDLNQCDDVNSPIFGGSHNCDPQSTKCQPLHGFGTRRGGYRCACLPGFLPPPAANVTLQNQYGATFYRCVPSCGEGKQCAAQMDLFLRTFILAAQLFCIVITVVLAVVVFRKRKCKTIASGMWTILETILIGILLLYASVIVHFFEPSIERCLFEPWFRELGFIVCYGAIILKLYRILMEFRTRKAHRWVVRDKDLLKYLSGMVVIMLAYLAAWTATNLNFRQEGFSLLTIGYTDSGLHFQACKPLWWDYVTEAGEMMILLFGLHLGLAARNATVQFEERRFLCCTVLVEAIVSCVFYVVRALYWNTLHPDQAFLAAFARSQLTNTLVLMLIFTPKLWYQHKQVRDSRHHLSHEPSDAYKPQDGVLYGDMDVAEVSLAEMNPEDIRAELKRLYTQLEVLKNKTIRQNNPHISKRRGGRKVAHRRFSLQALQRQQRQSSRPLPHETTEVTENEVSRTPEDSVCSMEGPSAIYGDGPSTYSELGGFGTPNILHRNKQ
ncbi:probable G-protein coupled receptor 158 isoform X2 [Macrosteles quadrilineatus]|uniref:probable G-protein coupled receptor 158 isoform X2 n=1 Tax=Macrosteles quadrilineatus TaxID=74068 RepID=UPI0023E339A5|nr:probable G-protein coupled receptor 158 isoform X2 [Macrosteles quadrilineatus]